MNEPDAHPSAGVEVFPVAMGRYDNLPPLDVVSAEERVIELLADFGCKVYRRWRVPMKKRGGDATIARLADWADGDARPSILYWVGHGWTDGPTAALAHARSAKRIGTTGISPAVLAEHIRRWEARADGEPWLLVILDTCQSARVAQLVAAELDNLGGPRRVAVLATSAQGSTTLGRFSVELDLALRHTFADDIDIPITSLVDELQRRLRGERRILNLDAKAVLRRSVQIAAGFQGPLDARTQLDLVLRDLPVDERRHFVIKAHGAELPVDGTFIGEPSWHFTGRSRERQLILRRLGSGGLTVVTGRAGSGKSALLGDIVVRSRPMLAGVLQAHGLMRPAAHEDPPPFHTSIHLTGMSADQLVDRLAADLSMRVPNHDEPFTARLDKLEASVRAASEPLRIVADGLDEAVDPHRAAAVLRRVGSTPQVSLLVGTRQSTQDVLDQPDSDDTNLLDSLGIDLADAVLVERDPDAAFDYARDRFEAARLHGVSSSDAVAAARAIAAVDQEFLFTRLATSELLRRPELISEPGEIINTLGSDHRAVFATTVERLRAENPAHPHLLAALAIAQGRGAPIRDGVWTTLASAVAQTRVSETAIHDLIEAASPYLAIDREADQTVYRLAHRTFAEHFTTLEQARAWHAAATQAAITQVEAHPNANPYWILHTSNHCVEAGRASWELVDGSAALDRISPRAVAADATRSLFGRGAIPLNIAAVVAGAHHLETLPSADRRVLMDIYRVRLGGPPSTVGLRQPATWTVAWAALSRRPFNAVLTGHSAEVTAVAALPLSGGQLVLASGSADGTVRLWDPATGNPVGAPLTGHTGGVWALAAVPVKEGRIVVTAGTPRGTTQAWDPTTGKAVRLMVGDRLLKAVAAVPTSDGRTLLATSQGQTVQVWDPATISPVGGPLSASAGWETAIAAFPLPDGRTLLAMGGSYGTVRLWDPATGKPVGDPVAWGTSRILAVSAVPLPDGGGLLATGDDDGMLRLWDPSTGDPVGPPMAGHSGPVRAVSTLPLPDGRALLATGGDDGTVRLWDPATGDPVGPPLVGHTGPVRAVSAVPMSDGRALLATGGDDGTVRLWDPATDFSTDEKVAWGTGRVSAVSAVPLPDGRTLLATCGGDGIVRLWDPATGDPVGPPLVGYTGPVSAVSAVPMPDGRALLAIGGGDGTIRLWDPVTGVGSGNLSSWHSGRVRVMTAVPMSDGRTLLATGGDDRRIRLWDPAADISAEGQVVGMAGSVRELTAVPLPDGRALLAVGVDNGTVRLWDPATGDPVGPPLVGDTGPVVAVAAVPMPDGRALLALGGSDGMVRLWDPATGDPVGRPLARYIGRVSTVSAVPMPDGRTLLATGGDDGTVRLWDPATGDPVGPPLVGRSGQVVAVAAVPMAEGLTIVATGTPGGAAQVWDASTWNKLRGLQWGDITIWGVVRLPLDDGRALLAVGGADGTVRLLDPVTGSAVGRHLSASPGWERAVAAFRLPDGRTLLALGGSDGMVRLWDTATGDPVGPPLAGHTGQVFAVAAVPMHDGRTLLATGGDDGTVRLWDPATGDPVGPPLVGRTGKAIPVASVPMPVGEPLLATAGDHGTVRAWDPVTDISVEAQAAWEAGGVRAVAAVPLPDGRTLLATAGDDGTLRLRYPITGAEAAGRLGWRAGRVWAMAAVPLSDGRTLLAAGGADGRVRLWDPNTGGPVGPAMTGHIGRIAAVAAVQLANGKTLLATGGDDGTLRLWDPDDGTALHRFPLGAPVHVLTPLGGGRLSVVLDDGLVMLASAPC